MWQGRQRCPARPAMVFALTAVAAIGIVSPVAATAHFPELAEPFLAARGSSHSGKHEQRRHKKRQRRRVVRSSGSAIDVRLGALSVDVPKGAIRRGQTLTIEAGAPKKFLGLGLASLVGGPYTIATSQGEPAKPVEVTFHYDPKGLAAGSKPLVLHGLSPVGDWVPEPGRANPAAQTVTAELDGFSPLDVADYASWLGGTLTGNRTDLPGNCGSVPDWVNGASLPYGRNDALPSCISRFTDAGTLRINVVNNRGYAQLVRVEGAQIDPERSDPWSDSLDGMISKQLARISPAGSPSAFVLSPGASTTIAIDRPFDFVGEKAISIQAAPRGGSAVAQMGWSFLNELKALKKFTVPIKVSNCVIGVIYNSASSGPGQASAINGLHSCVSAASGVSETAKAVMKKIAAAIFVTDIFNKVVDLTVDEAFPPRIGFSFKGRPETSRDIRLEHLDVGVVPAGQVTDWHLAASGGAAPYTFAVSTIPANAGRVPSWVVLSPDGTLSILPPEGTSEHVSFYVFVTDSSGQRSATGLWEVTFTVVPQEPDPVPPEIERRIGAGYGFSCGLREDGSAVCWGTADEGQDQAPGGTFTQIAVGQSHACALRSDESVVCWGSDFLGADDPPPGAFTQIAAGAFLSCGLRPDGSIDCWGDFEGTNPPAGVFKQVSVGNGGGCAIRVSDEEASCWGLVPTPPSGPLTRVTLDAYQTCGLRPSGEAVCEGDGEDGEGDPPSGKFIDISAGYRQTCAIRADRSLRCWGVDYAAGGNPLPSGKFVDLDLGDSFGCAIRVDGSKACWGESEDGATVPPGGAFTDVSEGGSTTCGIRAGEPVCWGRGYEGQTSPPAGPFEQVSSGFYHVCALRSSGAAACWGDNRYLQLNAPVTTFTDVLASDGFSCGVRASDGGLDCWGDVHEFDPERALVPPPSGAFLEVTGGRAAGGWPYACALRTNHTPVCWGAEERLTAPEEATFAAIAANGPYACGLSAAGEVTCWGEDAPSPPVGPFTQISVGSSYDCGIRTSGILACGGGPIAPAGTYVDLSAGPGRPCAIRSDGAVVCWGYKGLSVIPAA